MPLIAILCLERMKSNRVNPKYTQVKLDQVIFLDHGWLWKSQESLEITNFVTEILLTWTAQADLLAFSYSTETSR